MKKSFLIVNGLVLAAMPLFARTVALWPLNWNSSKERLCRENLPEDLEKVEKISDSLKRPLQYVQACAFLMHR